MKPSFIDLGTPNSPFRISILYEDRAVLAIDKPAGWLLVPTQWQQTRRNLQAAIEASIAAGEFWARSRSLRFLRYVHRLDADTSGVLLLVKSLRTVPLYTRLFEEHAIEKRYLAVVGGVPTRPEWTVRKPLSPDPRTEGRMRIDTAHGKEAETRFRLLAAQGEAASARALLEATPLTGRTHQIRVHLASCGHPVIGDSMYGSAPTARVAGPAVRFPLGLRAVMLAYTDPFTRKPVRIKAAEESFRRAFGFAPPSEGPNPTGRR
jgi:23S rRNA pseudouridine1911/1915/1917 synthase